MDDSARGSRNRWNRMNSGIAMSRNVRSLLAAEEHLDGVAALPTGREIRGDGVNALATEVKNPG